MNDLTLVIATDFTDAPGARNYDDGPDSGLEFYEKKLKPFFLEAREKNCKLIVDMDGTYGYATSFISEAFGTLSTDFGPKVVGSTIVIKSDEDLKVGEFTLKIIENPNFKC